MNIILFDDDKHINLLPLCFTRPCGDLRIGILTIREKWERYLASSVSFLTEDYLKTKFPTKYEGDNIYINGRILPDKDIVSQIANLNEGESLLSHDNSLVIAFRSPQSFQNFSEFESTPKSKTFSHKHNSVNFTYDVFSLNSAEISKDFAILTAGRVSESLSPTNTLIGNNLFIEPGARVEAAILNTTDGPIYIGKGSEIMEGSLVRGPFALCEHSTLKMGAKIYGGTTVGPESKVGGEVSNVVFQGCSNKGHDGFLGNSAIGEWCNLGADTNSSNLKNNYAVVKLWNYATKRFANTGLQFCGLIMGDHSKCGINTMFNTGTVVGVSANIFGAGFPRNFIPSYTWGGASGFTTYALAKAYETSEKVMQRRNLELTDVDKDILKHIFEATAENRFWENHA